MRRDHHHVLGTCMKTYGNILDGFFPGSSFFKKCGSLLVWVVEHSENTHLRRHSHKHATFFLNSWRLSQSASHCERCTDDLFKNWNSTWIYQIPLSFSSASQVERLFLEVFCISPWEADCHQGETVHSWPQIGWEVATEWILVAVENRSKLWSGKHMKTPFEGKVLEPKKNHGGGWFRGFSGFQKRVILRFQPLIFRAVIYWRWKFLTIYRLLFCWWRTISCQWKVTWMVKASTLVFYHVLSIVNFRTCKLDLSQQKLPYAIPPNRR